MNFRFKSFLFVWILSYPIWLSAQTYAPQPSNTKAELRGIIIDSVSKNPVSGATIQIVGTKYSAVSDDHGKFEFITALKLPVELSITFVGYKTIRVVATQDNQNNIIIPIVEAQNNLNSVVVVGYAEQRRTNLTSAINTVKGSDLEYQHGTSFSEKLQGSAPGLQVSSSSGVEGTAAFVRLRGATSINGISDPLYIIDGIFLNSQSLQTSGASTTIGQITTNPLADINPEDIESIDVLKDASATAMYGSRGANGVIIVKTKTGKKLKNSEVSIKSTFGISKVPKMLDLASGPQQAEILNEEFINDGGANSSRPYRPKSEGGAGNPEDQPTYEYQKAIFRTAYQNTNNVSVSGGSDKTTFYINGEYSNVPSTLKLQDFNRIGLRVNIDHRISRNIQIGTRIYYTNIKRRVVPSGDSQASTTNAGFFSSPLTPIYNADGSYYRQSIINNVYQLLANSNNHSYDNHLLGNVYLKWSIAKNLDFKSSFSLDDNTFHEVNYYNANLNQGVSTNGSGTDALSTNKTWIAEQLFNFRALSTPDHYLSFFLGNTLQKSGTEINTLTGTNYPSIQFTTISAAAVTTATSTGTTLSGLISYFGGANYSFKDKYVLDASLRKDGSSRFGPNNRWATFSSFGAAWNIGKESFIKDNFSFFNDLKIKSSLGWTGNQGISDFAYMVLWSGGNNYLGQPGISPSQLGNNNLKWETTRQWDIGLEESALANRLNFSFDIYNKLTTGLLLQVPTSAVTGFSSVYENIGKMSNKGIEFQVNSVNIRTNNFQWSTTFNIAHNKNLIVKLPTPITEYNRSWVRLQQGASLYSFWVYKQLYVDKETGNAVYDDSKTKDGTITADDRQIVGNAWPSYYGSLKNEFRYKNFNLSFNFYYSEGNKVLNLNRFFLENAGSRGTSWSMSESIMRRWLKAGDNTDIPRITTKANADGSSNHNYTSSRFVENGSFIRLQNVNFSYSLPQSFLNRSKVFKRIEIFANATNLFLITKYSGMDPEVNVAQNSGLSGTVQGLDYSTPPHPRTIQFGLNATL